LKKLFEKLFLALNFLCVMSFQNSYTHEEKHQRTIEVPSQSANGGQTPTFSFTEAVRNLAPEVLEQRIETFHEVTEITPAVKKVCDTEYEILRDYMHDHLEDLCMLRIQDTLEQFCDLADESLELESEQVFNVADERFDTENELFSVTNEILAAEEELLYDQALENAICMDQNEYLEVCESVNTSSIVNEGSFYKEAMEMNPILDHFLLSGQVLEANTSWSQREEKATSMLKSTEESHLKDDDYVGKRRLCRHFLKGRCNRGKSCDFLHDESIFCSDDQKVFLGGVPPCITDKILQRALKEQGYIVLNKPKVLQGFCPQICLGSVQEAKAMIRRGKIVVKGAWVDVRPYEAFSKDSLKMGVENEIKRSIFLGGLPSSTTGWMIKQRLAQLGFKTANHPIVKSGFAPQVMLESVEQAQRLVELKRIKMNKSIVEVRPYSRYRL